MMRFADPERRAAIRPSRNSRTRRLPKRKNVRAGACFVVTHHWVIPIEKAPCSTPTRSRIYCKRRRQLTPVKKRFPFAWFKENFVALNPHPVLLPKRKKQES